MSKPNIDQLILRMESYLECWKQFSSFLNMARAKKFGQEDENQFLELKSVLAQQLEIILAAFESSPLNRDEVHSLVSGAPSLRWLSEQNEGFQRNLESQWHKVYIGWQSTLGQLKAQQQHTESKPFWSTLFSKKR